MPTQSIIIGVDLAPIKPIPRAITFQSDITTDKCRSIIKSHLKNWKADTVLHDGAPNVGTAWVQDAFSQAELVLQSLRLATDFLIEGGTFVTKVFRSKDYNALLWVFKQLFTSVEATKPPSSRGVSAEIFVVCRGFRAAKRIDPKFLDPKHVFAELADPTPNNEAKVFNPEKKKRKREGYEEGNYTQYKEIPVTEFINTTDPISILGSYNRLSFEQAPGGDLAMATLNRLEDTTDEIRTCCEDLKLLGKKEFRNLLRWRLKVREKFGLLVKKGPRKPEQAEEVAEVAPMDEELAIQDDLQRLSERETLKRKKERRKENEKKRKEIVRLQMHMTTPMDIGMEQLGPGGENATFNLKPVDREGMRDAVVSSKQAPVESDDESESESESELSDDDDGDRLERDLDNLYEQYQDRQEERDSKLRAKKARKEYEADEWEGFSGSDKDSDGESDDESSEAQNKSSISSARPQSKDLSNNAALFFDQDIFQGLGEEDVDEDEEEDEDEDEDEDGDEEEEDSAIELQEDEGRGAKQSAKKQESKNAKDKKKKGEDVQTGGESDEEVPDEGEDPRKNNGQLGEQIFRLSFYHQRFTN